MCVTSGGTWQASPETRPELVLLAPAGLLLAGAMLAAIICAAAGSCRHGSPCISEPACGTAQPHTLRAMTGVFTGWSGPLESDNDASTVTAAWEHLPQRVNGRVKASSA